MTEQTTGFKRIDRPRFESLHTGPREAKARKVEVKDAKEIQENQTETSGACHRAYRVDIVKWEMENPFAFPTTFKAVLNPNREVPVTRACVSVQDVSQPSIPSLTAQRRTD